MEVKVSYKHLESTPSIQEAVEKKAVKLKKYFDGKMYVDWICSVEGDIHRSDVTVSGDDFQYHASSTNSGLYRTLDEVVQKLERQLRKKKEMIKNRIHRKKEAQILLFNPPIDGVGKETAFGGGTVFAGRDDGQNEYWDGVAMGRERELERGKS